MLCDVVVLACVVFFFKQKTAYEMRISDWSSDVCSSDLSEDCAQAPGTRPEDRDHAARGAAPRRIAGVRTARRGIFEHPVGFAVIGEFGLGGEGRAVGDELAPASAAFGLQVVIGRLNLVRPGLDRKSTRLNSSH